MNLAALAPQGKLRVGVNTGNRALVQMDGDTLAGIAPDIARKLADKIGAQLEFVRFASARELAAGVGEAWDIAFLADDPSRRSTIAFSQPYLVIEATLAVRSGVSACDWRDLDRPGTVILGVKGAAYERNLRSGFEHAEILLANNPADAAFRFVAGEADALAGIRESLCAAAEVLASARVLPQPFGRVPQAIGLPIAQADRISALNGFLDVVSRTDLP